MTIRYVLCQIRYFLLCLGIMAWWSNATMAQRNSPTVSLPPELDTVLRDSSSWWMQNSWHFNVYGLPLSRVYQDFNLITDSLEKHLEHVTRRLNVRNVGLISWYGFPDSIPSGKGTAKAYPEFGIVASVYNDSLRNFATIEVTQVILGRSWGTPRSRFMSDGMAAAMEGWVGFGKNRQRIQEVVWTLYARGEIPPIHDLIKNFDNYDAIESASVAASFLEYLLDKYGVAPLRAIYILAKGDDFPATFEKVYGRKLSAVEQDWVWNIK